MLKIKFQKQPSKNTCGQTCLSMLTGHPVEYIQKHMNRFEEVYTPDLLNALKDFGFYIHNNEKLIKQSDFSKMPELCIVKMVYHDKDYAHCIIKHQDFIYDPSSQDKIPLEIYYSRVKDKLKPVSYLEISKVKTNTKTKNY